MADHSAAKRAKRECGICHKMLVKLPDHLSKVHKLRTWEEREELMKEAFQKTPDLRLISEFLVKQLCNVL